jgi:hypothetical protein
MFEQQFHRGATACLATAWCDGGSEAKAARLPRQSSEWRLVIHPIRLICSFLILPRFPRAFSRRKSLIPRVSARFRALLKKFKKNTKP